MPEGLQRTNINTATTTVIKSGRGILHGVTVNTKGTGSTATLFDNTAGSGTAIAKIDTTVSGGFFSYDCSFLVGLTVVTIGSPAADLTLTWV